MPVDLRLPPSSAGQESESFSWDILRLILEGTSSIDLPSLSLHTREEASEFLLHYGYDLDDPHDEAETARVHVEAVSFLKRYLCQKWRVSDSASLEPDPDTAPLEIPAEIERPQDLRDLLVWASAEPGSSPRQLWACAVLRVMHTISHVNNALHSDFYGEIKRQILDRYKHHVDRRPDGSLWLGRGSQAVPLSAIYYKEEKSRDSMILKLLFKPDNVAQNIYDRIGVKIVVPTLLEAVQALQYLRTNNLIIFAHITPGRSRNTLLDLARFRRLYEEVAQEVGGADGGALNRALRERLSHLGDGPSAEPDNPFSSPHYRSIQFTSRQLIKVTNPTFRKARKLRAHLERYHLGPDLEALLDDLEGPEQAREIRFFFPYEVQILDEENHRLSLAGAASHAEYKLRQLQATRRRILGRLLYASPGGNGR
jgi:uncharacterized protein (TIGR04562 family)